MDMDPSSGQHQDMGTLENMIGGATKANTQERKPRPQQEQALSCPRCDSTNTKFCYYNNYSLSQPRYFCKSCRRYWTKGGTLRNVPVGGGCRKNKRSSSSSSTKIRVNDSISNNNTNPITSSLPHITCDHSSDLTLAFARLQHQQQQQKQNGQLGFDMESHELSMMGGHVIDTHHMISSPNPNSIHNSPATPTFLEALRSGFLDNPSSNFHTMYYNYENGSNGAASGGGVSGEMNMHEFVKEDESKTLWGFPWQNINNNGNSNGGAGDGVLDSARESWNYGLGSTNWHGLLNSTPLM